MAIGRLRGTSVPDIRGNVTKFQHRMKKRIKSVPCSLLRGTGERALARSTLRISQQAV